MKKIIHPQESPIVRNLSCNIRFDRLHCELYVRGRWWWFVLCSKMLSKMHKIFDWWQRKIDFIIHLRDKENSLLSLTGFVLSQDNFWIFRDGTANGTHVLLQDNFWFFLMEILKGHIDNNRLETDMYFKVECASNDYLTIISFYQFWNFCS